VRLRSLATIALLPSLAAPAGAQPDRLQRVDGGVIRGSTETRQLALVFTGHEFAESAATILDELARRRIAASFFLTGTFLRDRGKAPLVERMVREGHYVGPHSDAHLLYAPWTGPKVTLVSREAFAADLERNLDALRPFGVSRERARFFLPSYEWYTEEIARWTREAGLTLVCHTPGTRSNADYTEEGTPPFVATDAIVESILRREREDPHGLNGFLLLLHVGAGPGRTDKFHRRFGELLDALLARGYRFARVDELLGP
jgi:peptidoglycan/xylan/chitin deacetylase (PgdA/CDA1 family)